MWQTLKFIYPNILFIISLFGFLVIVRLTFLIYELYINKTRKKTPSHMVFIKKHITFLAAICFIIINLALFFYNGSPKIEKGSEYYTYLKKENEVAADYFLDLQTQENNGLIKSLHYKITEINKNEVTAQVSFALFPQFDEYSTQENEYMKTSYIITFYINGESKIEESSVENIINSRIMLLFRDLNNEYSLDYNSAKLYETRFHSSKVIYLIKNEKGDLYELTLDLSNPKNPSLSIDFNGKFCYAKTYLSIKDMY